MKKIYAIIGIVAMVAEAILSPVVRAEDLAPALVISEIGTYETSDEEWIEIYNNSGAALDMTGWKFYEEKTNHGLTAFRGDFILDSGEYAVIANKADVLAQKYPAFTGTLLDSSWSTLREDGEEIGVKDTGGTMVEIFTYPASSDSSLTGSSLERIDLQTAGTAANNWERNGIKNTIGAAREIVSTTPTATEIPLPDITASEIDPPLEPSAETVVPTPAIGPSPEPEPETPPPPPSPPPVLAPPPPPSISNSAPTATINIQSGNVVSQTPTTINFDGRSSFDPNGDPITYLWDMGDGTNALTANPAPHRYALPGTYLAVLTVIDPYGAKSSAQQLVQILSTPIREARTATVVQPPSPAPLPLPLPLPLPPPTPTSTISISIPAKTINKKVAPAPKKTKATAPKKGTYQNGDISREIEITEIFPSPGSKNKEEWIELHNAGSEPVSLGNWMLANRTKLKKPFIIPDLVRLEPDEYMIFHKSKTKITLKNGGDAVVLADFQGTVIDATVFDQATKDFTYALVESDEDREWQWTDSPTPAKQNPLFEKIEGTVTEVTSQAIQLTAVGDAPHTIHFDASILDPQVASAMMTTGSYVSLKAKKDNKGEYALQKIDDINAPAQAVTSGTTPLPRSNLPWIITIFTILAAAANTRIAREKAKELLAHFTTRQ